MINRFDKLTMLRLFFGFSSLVSTAALLILIWSPGIIRGPATLSISGPHWIGVFLLGLVALGFAWLFWRYSDQSVAGQLSSRIEEWLARPGFFSILFYSTLFTYILGIVILASLIKIQGAPFYSFILQIIPYILWLTGMSVLVLFTLVLSRQNQGFLSLIALALLLILLVAGV